MSNVLPTWRPPKPTITRPSAERVNELQPQKQTITVAGYGEVVPLVYGRAEVAGPVIAGPIDKVNGTIVYYAIALSHGTINRIISAKVGSDKHAVNVTPTAAGAAHTITGDGYTYECRFYNGNQTTRDSMLAGQLTNYNDVFSGVSYVRIKVSGVNASWGGIDFEIDGKKVFDPRINTTVYSENPALHLNDFVSNPVWGLGRNVVGVVAAANECDRILAYGPKARTGHTINVSASESGNLELLAMYAECLFGFAGDAVIIVPDAAVDESEIIDIPIKQIWNGSVRPSSKSAENIPSSITITFNTKDTDGLAGSPAYVSIEQTSASDPVVNSALTLIGVYRREEAQRRANQRLAQLRTPGRVSFQMFDSGIYFKAGDVVRMPDIAGLGGSLFRLVSDPTMVRSGVYQLDGEVYESRNYITPLGTTNIPQGAVIFRMDSTVPPNTEPLDSLGMLRGGTQVDPFIQGENDAMFPSKKTYTTVVSGMHRGENYKSGRSVERSQRVNSSGLSWYSNGDIVIQMDAGSHSHRITRNIDAFGSTVYERFNLRALRVLIDLSRVPNGTVFFSRESFLDNIFFGKIVAKGLLSIANNEPSGALKSLDFICSDSGQHMHQIYQKWEAVQTSSSRFDLVTVGDAVFQSASGGADGMHRHKVNLISNAPNLKTRNAFAFSTKTTESRIPEGAIFGYVGLGDAPDGWHICNGLNGTDDLTDSFIGFDTVDSEGASEIPTITATGLSLDQAGEHDHEGSPIYAQSSASGGATHNKSKGLHTHSVTDNQGFPISVRPRYTKLRFIQYIGE